MSHPNGGHGNNFRALHTFEQAYAYVGEDGMPFISTTGKRITARRGMARDGITKTIVFKGTNCIHGNVCYACWGYRENCSRTRIGQCTEALDRHMS